MLDVMRFWLDRGVDGFRVDAIWHLIKDDAWRDNPTNPAYDPAQGAYHEYLHTYSSDRPEVHAVIARMRKLVDGYPARVLIGEIYLPIERVITYYGADGSGVHLPFNFQLLLLPWQAPIIKEAIDNYEAALPENAWPDWVRWATMTSRASLPAWGPAQARVAAMLLLTLRGTPTLYCGDELGMRNVPVPPECVQDPLKKNMRGLGFGRDRSAHRFHGSRGRTLAFPPLRRGCRCPMTAHRSMWPRSRKPPTPC